MCLLFFYYLNDGQNRNNLFLPSHHPYYSIQMLVWPCSSSRSDRSYMLVYVSNRIYDTKINLRSKEMPKGSPKETI